MLFDGKNVLIIGGTGSLGIELIKRIYNGTHGIPKRITIFSRDELKQFELRKKFPQKNLYFVIGDVRDKSALIIPVKTHSIVLNLSALKHVPPYEVNPNEAIKTNTLGVNNIIELILHTDNKVEKFLQISTDKACKPVNTYGMTKALAEKITLAANLLTDKTDFLVVRYGNVLTSRGSFLPILKTLLEEGKDVYLTDKKMTRFFMTYDNACDLIFRTLKNSIRGTIAIPKIPSVNILNVINIMRKELRSESKIIAVGIRPGEKIHEILISDEEMSKLRIFDQDYIILAQYLINPMLENPTTKNNPFDDKILKKIDLHTEYSSNNSIVDNDEVRLLLKSVDLI